MKANNKGERPSLKNALDRLMDFLDGQRDSTAADIRDELTTEKEHEKKHLSTLQKILIGIGILLVLALPALIKLFWTVSGYFWQKNL